MIPTDSFLTIYGQSALGYGHVRPRGSPSSSGEEGQSQQTLSPSQRELPVAHDACTAHNSRPCISPHQLNLSSMPPSPPSPPRACPHHTCSSCGRSTSAAGGLLFRCECCVSAFCEDCLPDSSGTSAEGGGLEIVGECAHFKGLGQVHPRQACFVICGERCR